MVVNFLGEEKCTPRVNPGYAYDCDAQLGPNTLWNVKPVRKSSCNRDERPRSYFRVPETSRAAALRTRCNLSVTYCGDAARAPMQ